MKFFFQLFVLIASFYVTSAAVAKALPHPDFPGKCYDYTRTYDVGVYYPKDSCMKITCNRDFSMDFVSCGTVGVPEGFRNVPDMSKRYPGCCVNIVANEDYENIIE